ncbi:hypothetical protein VPHK567_0328 [Vibrio phage K567]
MAYESVFNGTNRYKVLREGRDYINKVAHRHGAVDKGIYVTIDYHVIDRIMDHEFPARVFEVIVGRLIKNHQDEIMKLANMPDDERPKHINVYGNKPGSPYMVGVTINKAATGKVYVNLRTCYKERNSKYRQRIIEAYKIRVKTSSEIEAENAVIDDF